MTRADVKTLDVALHGYVGAVGPVLWGYLELCLNRRLNEAERQEILRVYFGHQ